MTENLDKVFGDELGWFDDHADEDPFRTTTHRCSGCDGLGVVDEVDLDKTYTCPMCKGTGRIS